MAKPESSLSLGGHRQCFVPRRCLNKQSEFKPATDSRTSLKLFGLMTESAFTIIWNPVRWN
jgi:hypothetical protein